MEIDVKDISWKYALVSATPAIEDGHLLIPTGTGWGAKDVVHAHPPLRTAKWQSQGSLQAAKE